MDPTLLLMILLFGILGSVSTRNYYVAAPSSLRLNSEETIGIVTEGYSGGIVRVYVQDYPGKRKNISDKIVNVIPGDPRLFKIRLDPQEFPSGFLTSPDYPKFVSLNVQFLNDHFQIGNKEILIPISGQSGYLFIQTDKPIYTPDERVYMRIIPLDEDSLPSYEPLKLQITNPNGDIVEQKELRTSQRDKAFVSVIYNFPSYSSLGEWSARVYYGHNFTQNSTVRFQLDEYVLPFFTVELETPDILLPTDETITVKVVAKYSYGKNVKGFVSFRIGPKTVAGEILYKATFVPQKLEDGSFELTFETQSLWGDRSGHFSAFEGSRLYVEATVVDTATGKEEKAVDSKCIIASNPFEVSFKRCLRNFKPGFTTVVEADITYRNGLPAKGILVKIEAVADTSKRLTVVNSAREIDENGRVSFEVQPEVTHKTVAVKLQVVDEKYGDTTIGHIDLVALENDAYILLARNHPSKLKPNQSFGRNIHFEPVGLTNIYYLVVARGKILTLDKLPEGEYKHRKVRFNVTHEMVPSFRILVFAQHGRQLLADSLKIEVENVCHPDAKVSIDPVFDIKEPGYSGKVVIRGTKGTSVGLLGVDEAVYAMSKKDLLTNTEVFNRLASHDLGCGPGSGETIHAVLGNAGVTMATNHFSPSPYHSCLERKRKKRAVYIDIVNNYEGFERHCCSLGIEYDYKSRSCEERRAIVDNYLTEEEYLNCSKVFLECCRYQEKFVEPHKTVFMMTGASFDTFDMRTLGRNQGVRGGIEPIFLDRNDLDNIEAKLPHRKDFKQTWFHEDVFIGSDKREEVGLTLPDSITTWIIQGVSLSPRHGICVAEPQRIESTKKIFTYLNLPYSVVRNEQIEIQATVFNYVPMPIAATVYMYGAKGLCSGTQPNKRSEIKEIIIDALSSKTVTFPVIPLKAEVIPIKVVVLSLLGSDIVIRNLNVVPEGVTKEIDIAVRLDPANKQGRLERTIEDEPFLTDKIDPSQNLQVTTIKLCTPENFVPGTESCSITAVGDIYGPAVETAVNNPGNLIKLPSGCGEQNMVNLAPTLYTMRYLKITGKLTPENEEMGYQYMRKGYAHQISKYKKEDGSYAAFDDRQSSTWLTAFVIKVFCQANELIYVDEEVLCSGVRWLINNQQSDGSFTENYPLYSPELMGGLQGRAPMTAFVLITLEECKCEQNNLRLAKLRAVSYLEDHLTDAKSPLSAAIVAYALALSDSEFKGNANENLLSMATFNEGRNWLYWSTQNSAHDVQTAGYALLAQLLLDDMDKSASIVNWLNTRQLQSGACESTQETVMALQALSEYAIQAQMPSINLESNISSSNDGHFHRNLLFNDQNAIVLQNVKVNKVGGTLFIKTKGSGMGLLSVKLRYNVVVPPEEICKFDIKINVTDRRNDDVLSGLRKELSEKETTGAKSTDKKLRYNMRVCVRYLGERDTEMSIVDVGLFTGFLPVEEELKLIQNDLSQLIQKYEITGRSVVFYLEKIPVSEDYCFSFHVVREFIVGNTQMTAVRVYDYYNPSAKCTKFYKPDSNSPLIRTLCSDGICQCAEGGCPPKTPFGEIRVLTIAMRDTRREMLKSSLCDDYDYAWIGKVNGRIKKDGGGFLNISFTVNTVVKPGIEKTEDIEGETRILLARDDCATAKMFPGVEYLILGQDGQRYMNENGVPWYRYLLDQGSVVHMWVSSRQATDIELQRDLSYVVRELKNHGCEY